MLKVRISNNGNMLGFHCPYCGSQDVVYIHMPSTCWRCKKNYEMDVRDIIETLSARYEYHACIDSQTVSNK